MTHPNREELAGLLEQAAIDLHPYSLGEVDAPCLNVALPAYLNEAAAALRQSPTVEEVETLVIKAVHGPLSATEAAQAIDALYRRGGGA